MCKGFINQKGDFYNHLRIFHKTFCNFVKGEIPIRSCSIIQKIDQVNTLSFFFFFIAVSGLLIIFFLHRFPPFVGTSVFFFAHWVVPSRVQPPSPTTTTTTITISIMEIIVAPIRAKQWSDIDLLQAYSQPCQTYKMKSFAKIVTS